MTKISVCMPTYNSQKFIQKAIESVLSQTYRDFELLIVDDCSKDNTINIARSIKDSRIKIHQNERNLGMVRNFNRCLELAECEIITTLDSDDLMLPENLERKIKLLESHPQMAFACSNVHIIDENNQIKGSFTKESLIPPNETVEEVSIRGLGVFKKLLIEENFICKSSVILRRKIIQELGLFNLKISFAEDYEMWARMALKYDVGYIKIPLAEYRVHHQNYTKGFIGEKKVQGNEQITQIKRDLLQQYFALNPDQGRLFSNQELASVYQEFAFFYFSQNRLDTVRVITREAFARHVKNFHLIKYYLLSFLPLGFIKLLKKLKVNK